MSENGIFPWDESRHGRAVHRPDAPAKFVVNDEKRVIIVKLGKKVTAEDIRRYVVQLQAHPSFQPSFSEIVDLRAVEELDLQANDFLKLADEIDPFSPGAKRAFVVRNAVQAHAARMHKALRTQAKIRVFHSLQEAERWIYE